MIKKRYIVNIKNKLLKIILKSYFSIIYNINLYNLYLL